MFKKRKADLHVRAWVTRKATRPGPMQLALRVAWSRCHNQRPATGQLGPLGVAAGRRHEPQGGNVPMRRRLPSSPVRPSCRHVAAGKCNQPRASITQRVRFGFCEGTVIHTVVHKGAVQVELPSFFP